MRHQRWYSPVRIRVDYLGTHLFDFLSSWTFFLFILSQLLFQRSHLSLKKFYGCHLVAQNRTFGLNWITVCIIQSYVDLRVTIFANYLSLYIVRDTAGWFECGVRLVRANSFQPWKYPAVFTMSQKCWTRCRQCLQSARAFKISSSL